MIGWNSPTLAGCYWPDLLYAYGAVEYQGSAAPRAKRRKVLAEVMSEANPGTSADVPQSRAACGCHGVALCLKSDCWDLYYAQIAPSGHE